MALTRTVTLNLFAQTAKAQAQLDAIEAEAKKLSDLNPSIKPEIEKSAALKQMAVLRAELKAQGDAAGQDLGTGISDGAKKGLGSQGAGGGGPGWIATLIGLGAPLAGPLAAAGLAFGAFGGLAVKSLLPVEKAMTGPGGLSAGWVTLDARQRTAAAGVQALKTRYDGLSKSMEPRTFQVFNTLLSTANGLLGPSARLATASGAAVEGFLVKFENDSGLRQFVGYASTVAPQAIGLLGTDVTTLVHSVLTLAQAAGGTGLLELRVLTGGLQAVDTVVSHLPGPLAGAALGIGGIALGLSKLGLLSRVLRITGLAAMGSEAVAAATGIKDASVATRGLAGAQAALDAVSPFAWVALGVAALTGLVLWLGRLKGSTDTTISAIEKQNNAVGFNTKGYFAAASALGALNQKQEQQNVAAGKNALATRDAAVSLAGLRIKTDALTAAQKNLISAGREQNSFLTTLESKYGITRQQAVALAQASGVLVDKTGHIKGGLRDATSATEAYANSNLAARAPVSQLRKDVQDYSNATLTATARQKALTDALNQFFNPAVTADQATLTLKQDQQALAKALHASGGETKDLSGKQGAARGAFDTYISQVGQTATSVFNATGKTSDYTKIISDALPFLERAAGKNRALRQEIRDLISTEAGMRSENVAIRVSGSGHWVVTGGGQFGNKPIPVAASGMFVSQGTPGVDDQLIRAQRGELVVPVPLVRSGAVDHLKGLIPGFAAGGVVGSYAGSSLPGLDKWLISENSQTIRAIQAATAKATAAGLRAAALGGGSGAQVAKYALGFQGAPYVLGGASPHGWDCSGFTAWVYEHFGLMPARQGSRFGTSESQFGWVKRTPKPEVGGLAFFDDGVFANPGHVGVIIGGGQMISAQDPANGTQISGIGGAVGFGIPPGRSVGSFEGVQGGGKGLPGGGSVTANMVIGRQEASGFGWGTGPSWADLDKLWTRESGWRNTAQNPTSSAYGIAQFLDGTWATVGGHKTSNPGLQVLYGLRYIQRKYGDPEAAWAHELAFNSYAGGTSGAAPGWAVVGEAGPELVKFRGGEKVVAAASAGSARPASTVPGGGGGGRSGPPPLTARQIAGLALAVYYEHPQSATADRAEERRYLRDIAKYYSGSSAKWRDKAVERQTGHLISVGDKISALSSKIASARSYQQSVQQGLAGYADLSQMTLGGSMQGSRTLSGAQSLNAQLGGQLGNLKKFAAVLRKLAAAKVDSALIRQVVALGPGDGTAFGEEILAGGPALIKSLNATESAIGKTETQISRGAASAVYEGRYEPGKDFLKQLQAQKAGLRELFRDLGQELGREASRWFRVPRRRRPKGMAAGGVISEPIYGWGASGQEYMFGERGPERVTPLAGGSRTGPVVSIGNVYVREAADIGIISQKVGFAISAAGLG